jgi:leucyl-tRNA synthetase
MSMRSGILGLHSKLWRAGYLILPNAGSRVASTSTSSTRLDFPLIDKKWQQIWRDAGGKQLQRGKGPKSYILSMFPYPSGTLHMGHVRVYTIIDVLARFKHMQGRDVLYPMGWDAFGLPAENAAIERGIDPADWTKQNVKIMKEQLQMMNGGIDWSRELMTSEPAFYKHTQHIFLLLHQHGLAYQANSLVNYDPVDKTVLANEQVDVNGRSWRSGAVVEKRQLKQWFFKISEYRDALLEDLDFLSEKGQWPERVLTMQRNWLGKSSGAKIKFPLLYEGERHESLPESIEVYTTRSDTMFGVQYLALSLSHPIVLHAAKHDKELKGFLQQSSSLPYGTKAGHLLKGVKAQNPMSKLPNTPDLVYEPLPVFVAPYVLDDYGEGAVMGVPGHDSRDFEFWKENGKDPARQVIFPERKTDADADGAPLSAAFTLHGVLGPNCGKYAGIDSKGASISVILDLNEIHYAKPAQSWKLRDWLVSRQRYWGTPIPIVHCQNCGAVPVPMEDLPVELPKITGDWFKGKTGNPLESAEEWLNTPCPKCKGPARRDTDTMDTFVDSSWYFMRFIDPSNVELPFSAEQANALLPVDVYIGGIEHAILHLLYARFMTKFMAAQGYWPDGASNDFKGEPFRTMITQGMVHGKTYSDPENGRFLRPEELDMSDATSPKILSSGQIASVSYEKMSKSKYNGVDPSSCIEKYGADVTRAHMLFQAPVSEVLEWEEERIAGVQRWLNKVWRLVEDVRSGLAAALKDEPTFLVKKSGEILPVPTPDEFTPEDTKLWIQLDAAIGAITTSLSKTYSLNTVISDLMSLTNALNAAVTAAPATSARSRLTQYHATSCLLRLLAPICPAFAEEAWSHLHSIFPFGMSKSTSSIFAQPFPVQQTSSEAPLKPKTQRCAVSVNGKLRFAVTIGTAPEGLDGEARIQKWALEEIRKTKEGGPWLKTREQKVWKRIVVVKGGRGVNFVS